MKDSTTSSSHTNNRITNFASQLLKSPLNLTKSKPLDSRTTQSRSYSLDHESTGKLHRTDDVSFTSKENLIYFEESEGTLNEIMEFMKKLSQSKTKMNSTSKLKIQIMSDAANSMKKMIEKSKGSGSVTATTTTSSTAIHPLLQSYETLMKQLDRHEMMMTKIQDLYSSNKDSLLAQSDQLRSRLVSCIKYNRKRRQESKFYLDESKKLSDRLTKAAQYVKEMEIFYDELLNMKAVEESAYVSWALRTGDEPSSTVPSEDVYDKGESYHRYRKLIKAKKFSLMCLVYHTRENDRYATMVKNAEHALHHFSNSLEAMGFNSKVPSYFNHGARVDFDDEEEDDDDDDEANSDDDPKDKEDSPSKKSSVTRSDSSRNRAASYPQSSFIGNDDSDEELQLMASTKSMDQLPPKKYVNFGHILVEEYDHSLCADCSLVTSMATEAYQRFRSVYQQSFDAAKMLQRLDKQREELKRQHSVILGIIEQENHHHHHP